MERPDPPADRILCSGKAAPWPGARKRRRSSVAYAGGESYSLGDIWLRIHSLMPMRDAARSACTSQAFLRSWRCHPNLTLNRNTLSLNPFKERKGDFVCKIDSVLRNHSSIGLKILHLDLHDDPGTFVYVDSWLQVAVTPGIEELMLMLYEKYNLPCSLLSDGVRNSIRYLRLQNCAFHPTVELGPLRSLTSLRLQSVNITGDELECLISNTLALEQLQLSSCENIIFLKIPCVLQQLKSLSVKACQKRIEIEIEAPNLYCIYFYRVKIKFLPRGALLMKDFTLHCRNSFYYARAKLLSVMPNLETLLLLSFAEVVNTPMLPTKLFYLKHLTIQIITGGAFSPSYDYFSLVSFLDASPSLETLILDVSQGRMEHESVFGGSSHLRQLPELRLDCLKRVKILGFCSAKGLVELTCCILKNAVSLEHIVLNTLCEGGCCSELDNGPSLPIGRLLEEAFRAVSAIRLYIENEVPPSVKLTVVEPCARCHSSMVVPDAS
uniref:At1g61320/AtMIF1 LRR domain-containing protein n=1 Tax=Leersia perrieri TaxID=77586 RepID=A0A0D9WCC1_9ORYZ